MVNAPGAGLGTNWVQVSGSAATDAVAIPFGSTNGGVLFRLVYPQFQNCTTARAKLFREQPTLRKPAISHPSLQGWVDIENISDEHVVRELIPQHKALMGKESKGIIEYPTA